MAKPEHFPARFWANVSKSDGCWEWNGTKIHGYGVIRFMAKWKYAHRTSWEMHNGPIPPGMNVCHHCDNRACINPSHLFIGTQSDNMKDAAQKGRMRSGERNPRTKLRPSDVEAIREAKRNGFSNSAIARLFGISDVHVRRIALRTAWK